jgi:hemerythrin superfamily protein
MAMSQPNRNTQSSRERPSAFQGATGAAKVTAKASTLNIVRKSASPDATTLLRADHKAVTALFEKFEKMNGDGPNKKALVERICNELTVHTQIEEEIFYPAARAALKDEDMMDEAQVEHNGAKDLIAQLRSMNPGEDMYDAKVTVLSEYIKHHVKEEQTEMFPKAKKSKLDLKALGAELQARKEELLAQLK